MKLKDFPLQIIDGDRGSNYPKNHELLTSGSCLFLSAKNVTTDGFSFTETQFIDQNKDAELKKGKLQRNDIILTTRGTLGNLGFYNQSAPYDQIRINSGMVILRCEESRLIPEYFFYLLRSRLFSDQVENFRSGSAQPQLPIRDLINIDLPLPSIEEQLEAIKQIGAIEEKLKLNRRINETLEQIGQVLFKRWFVDFEFPNENGQPYKSAGGKMKDSPLGPIPEDWSTGKLEDITQNFDSKRVPLSSRERDTRKGPYPYYGATSVMDHIDNYLFNGEYLLLSEDGSVINLDNSPILQYVWGKFWVSNHAHVLKEKGSVSLEYLFLLLKQSNVGHLVSGAVQLKINKSAINNFQVIVPHERLLEKFSETIKPIFTKIRNIQTQNETLTNLRDSLIPRLISGKIIAGGDHVKH